MSLEKSVNRLQELIVQLRQECPWDKKQTHESLKRHLLEETYETIEAIDALGDPNSDEAQKYAALKDELGDLLYQVFFHSLLATEAGQFDIISVIEHTADKLYRRHPHVFGEADIETEADLALQWEEIKKAEKETESVMDNLPNHLPALLFATKVLKKSKVVGVDRTKAAGQKSGNPQEQELAEMLWQAILYSAEYDLDAEDILRKTAQQFATQVRQKEVPK